MLCYKFYTYKADPRDCERWVLDRQGRVRGDPSNGWVTFWIPYNFEIGFINLFRDYIERQPQGDF